MDKHRLVIERADRLRQARIAAGFTTARAAARKVGVKESTYRTHENGAVSFDADMGLKYARTFGVSLEWLMLPEMPGGQKRVDATEVSARRLLERVIRALDAGDIRGLADAVDHAKSRLGIRPATRR